MGQILHGSATTTHAVRAAIQRSKATIAELSAQYGVNPKTVLKWRNRSSVEELPMGPKGVRSTVLSTAEGKLHMFVAIDRTSKFAFVELHERATRRVAGDFLGTSLRLFLTRSTRCSPTTAHSSPHRAMSLPQRD